MTAFATVGGKRLPHSTAILNQSRCDLPLEFKRGRFASTCSNMAQIEVEKNFKASPQSQRHLLDSFPHDTVVTAFEDTYFSEQLALSNRWLRKRNSAWEMKVPIGSSTTQSGKAAVFRELMGAQIWEFLTQNKDFTQDLKPFARIKTLRTETKLPWDQYTANLTFDVCSSEDGFEYTLGEAEILVETAAEVNPAINVLGELITHLGLEELDEKDGKLLSYLRSKKRSLYTELLKVLCI